MSDTLLKPIVKKNEYKNRNADERQGSLHKKFPKESFLGNQRNVDHFMQWVTFFRRNIHRFATDYLGLNLYWYQIITLYLFGINKMNVIIASRGTAKSYIVAIYACCRCILYPNSQVVIASSTKNQSRLIVSAKIEKELMRDSPPLRREIKSIKQNQNDTVVFFHNGSTITVVPANDNSRGYRSNVIIRDEYRLLSKKIDDSVLSPFQMIRQTPYNQDPYYSKISELKEQSVDIYISSSWLDNGHWMWNIADQAFKDMLNDEGSVLLSFDEALSLREGLKTIEYFRNEKKKQDPITYAIEILNERVKENTASFFPYSLLQKNQRCRQPFYPSTAEEYLSSKKNPWQISKLPGEIRLLSCDMAFITNEKGKNDNSIFSCIRLLPEKKTLKNSNSEEIEVSNGYHISVHYMKPIQGGDIEMQSLEIRRLYESWQSDYLVLDVRNAGIAVYDKLAKPMYDDEYRIEYPALCAMNSDEVANRIKSESAEPKIYVISASQRLNSDIAMIFRRYLSEEKIDLLIPFETAKEELLPRIKEYITAVTADEQIRYEYPFLETQALISETANLQYEKKSDTGVITIKELNGWRKDRYTSVSYGVYVADLLSRDLLSTNDDYEYVCFIN